MANHVAFVISRTKIDGIAVVQLWVAAVSAAEVVGFAAARPASTVLAAAIRVNQFVTLCCVISSKEDRSEEFL